MRHLAIVLLLGGCALNPFETRYLLPGPPRSVEGPAVVGVAPVIDQRGAPPGEIGAVRTERPVADLVGDAFRASLAARSLLAERMPRTMLTVTVLRYSCDPVPQERVGAKFHVALSDASGRALYGDDVDVENTEGTVFALDTGAAASAGDLRRLAQRTLQQAVDDAIDKPDFRAALGG